MMCTFEKCGEKNGRPVCCCKTCGRKAYSDNPETCFAQCKLPAVTTITQLTESTWLHECRNCDWTLEADCPDEVLHTCGKKEVVRLGDQIKAGLEHIGVVQENVENLLAKIGLPCGCDGRRKFLNNLDEAVGLGEKLQSFKLFMGWG